MSVSHPTLSPHCAFFSAVLSGQMAAYMLGMALMPPPQPNEVAVALANHVLDHPDANLNPEFGVKADSKGREPFRRPLRSSRGPPIISPLVLMLLCLLFRCSCTVRLA